MNSGRDAGESARTGYLRDEETDCQRSTQEPRRRVVCCVGQSVKTCSGTPLVRGRVEQLAHLADVAQGFRVRRHPAVSLYRPLPRVVGRQSRIDIVTLE